MDGAIAETDYLSRMIEGAKNWIWENPGTVGSTACSGITLVAAVIMSRISKKERQNGEQREGKTIKLAQTLNNNAVELAETVQTVMKTEKEEIVKTTDRVMNGFSEIGEEIVAELRANRMETKANSLLVIELLKDARLPAKRKEEILAMYNRERGEEAEADDEIDEA